ncbi:MAG: hypothetical protein DDT42_01707 [candidate division WS2 bacterium]|uniref:HVO-A0261-like N-terminal domain-containing protein n=1 Tax=Psychracetigena formicireducens TaxID=2986056 RepID=A0A9E2F6Y4_PSYF1|nr:hypothetical protein [Candidatus Psychracetigena formicireducens]
MNDKKKIEDTNWLLSGKYRVRILEILSTAPSTPSEIAEKINISRASMSRILKALREKSFIDCTSSSAKNRLYFITDAGKKIFVHVHTFTKQEGG